MTTQTDDFGFTSFNDLAKDDDGSGFVPFKADTTPEPLPHPQPEDEEGWGSWLVRTLYQIPSGIAQAVTYPIDLMSMLASGEARDPEEIEHIRMISQREGIPFDEEKYMQAVEQAERTFPTQSNIERGIEESTGLPLTPKTGFQKALKFASTGGTLAGSKGLTAGKEALKYEPMGFRGVNVSLPRPILGAGLEATKEILEEAGLPEPVAELASFAILKQPTEGAASLDIGKKRKESGLIERQFEKTTKPREVSEKKIGQINEKLESDFKSVSDKIIAESPIGETAYNLANDPTFKQTSAELLDQAQEIANNIPGTLPTKSVKKEYADIAAKSRKGFHLDEYDKSYMRYMKDAVDNIPAQNMTHGELIESYRKNNSALGEYYEPGSSKAANRAKKDSLLDQNRAIAIIIEKTDPKLAEIFKEGNARWSKIKDVEAIDELVESIFPENKKINFKEIENALNDKNYQRIFKRSLGEKGFKDFEQALKDMLTSEKPYKMLKVAQNTGIDVENLIKTGGAYFLSPHFGYAKVGYDFAKKGYRSLMNAMLDKPQIGFSFKKAVNDLKSGKFAEAEKEFEKLHVEIESPKEKPLIESNQ
jgi:hypothetical protein